MSVKAVDEEGGVKVSQRVPRAQILEAFLIHRDPDTFIS